MKDNYYFKSNIKDIFYKYKGGVVSFTNYNFNRGMLSLYFLIQGNQYCVSVCDDISMYELELEVDNYIRKCFLNDFLYEPGKEFVNSGGQTKKYNKR